MKRRLRARKAATVTDGPSFFERLKAEASDEWHDYCHHDFVNQLGDGSLVVGPGRTDGVGHCESVVRRTSYVV